MGRLENTRTGEERRKRKEDIGRKFSRPARAITATRTEAAAAAAAARVAALQVGKVAAAKAKERKAAAKAMGGSKRTIFTRTCGSISSP